VCGIVNNAVRTTGWVKPTARTEDPQPWPALSVPDTVVWVDVEADAESELVLFNSETDTYHSLDPTAGFVWRGIAHGDGIVTIVAALSSRYAGDGVVILRDVQAFIDEAIGLGLLAVARAVR
jgi:Coenzyme PQQ synthesis protein D (PqqD)